jgi:hypothetical protein
MAAELVKLLQNSYELDIIHLIMELWLKMKNFKIFPL